MTWTQNYDPFGHWWLSTLVAALPIIVLLGLLAGFKVRPHICAIAGAATALLCAAAVFGMPIKLAAASFFYGVGFGLLKIVWIVVAAVFLYDISVETGQFEIMKESVAAITPDRRLQLLLVAFCFGSFIEGSAGFGAPVAIAGSGARDRDACRLEFNCKHRAGGLGSDRHARPHAGRGLWPSGRRPEQDDRPNPAIHRGDRALLAGSNDGELGGNVRSVSRDSYGRILVRGNAILLVQPRG